MRGGKHKSVLAASQMFYYDPSIPSCLRRKIVAPTSHFEVGSPAGSRANTGYWRVGVTIGDSKGLFQCHRLVWAIHYGEIPKGLEIDHIDGNKDNNTIGNLRCVTGAVNSRNARKAVNSGREFAGVTYKRNHDGHCYWVAVWKEDCKDRSRAFSVSKFGDKAAKAAAEDFRETKIIELNTKGYGYTGRHGK